MSTSSLRRRLLVAALASGALVAAVFSCAQPNPPQPGGVSGTYDLARVGSLVFVTSADRAELRVLDARADGGFDDGPRRDWVRAPNPLEALQIPVIERPVGLARDLAWATQFVDESTPAGGEITGPYVYAFASARPEISVVGADRAQLRELKRISTSGPVTAVSAIGPSAASGQSLLFYSTVTGGAANLYTVSLAPPDQVADQVLSPQLIASYPGETIVALQALPRRMEIAVATRSLAPSLDGGSPAVSGRAFALPAGGGTPRLLQFTAPIRLLATHPGTRGGEILPETNLFGLVDEESCGGGGAPVCARILAVDLTSGLPALDWSGSAALPIAFAHGLPQSLTFTANARVRTLVGGDGGILDVPVMGLCTSTDGLVHFFEAVGRPVMGGEPQGTLPVPQWTLRHVNQAVLSGVGTNFFFINADGGAIAFPDQPPADTDAGVPDAGVNAPYHGLVQLSVVPGLGSAIAEPVAVTFEGTLPGLVSLPTQDADGQTFPLPAGTPIGAPDGGQRVQTGDRVVIELAGGVPCGEVGVTSVSGSALGTTDPIPPGCAGRASFTVRAAGQQPYVVVGLLSGYMDRVGDGTKAAPDQPVVRARFSFQGTPYYRPDPTLRNPLLGPSPALAFDMGLRPPGIQRDFRFTFQTSTGFLPLTFSVSTDIQELRNFRLPYGVVHLPEVPRVYISYPSVPGSALLGAGAVIEVNPTTIVPTQPSGQITSVHR